MNDIVLTAFLCFATLYVLRIVYSFGESARPRISRRVVRIAALVILVSCLAYGLLLGGGFQKRLNTGLGLFVGLALVFALVYSIYKLFLSERDSRVVGILGLIAILVFIGGIGLLAHLETSTHHFIHRRLIAASEALPADADVAVKELNAAIKRMDRFSFLLALLEGLAGEKSYVKRDFQKKIEQLIQRIEDSRADPDTLKELKHIVQWEAGLVQRGGEE